MDLGLLKDQGTTLPYSLKLSVPAYVSPATNGKQP